jgi:hypothetical protein
MWKSSMRTVRVSGILLLVALLTTGCFFDTQIESFISNSDGSLMISMSAGSTRLPCDSDEDPVAFECSFFFTDSEGESELSTFTLSGIELLFFLYFYDPLVLQVPLEASNFQGSYFAQGGSGGSLVITPGLTSIRVDATRTMQAEPGMQLVIVDFPSDAPASGEGGFNLNFRIPDDVAALDIKALFTGRVTLDDETYYVPLFPCTSDIAALPMISVPIPDGGNVSLPVDDAQGCENEVYTFSPAQKQFESVMRLPLLGK